MAESTFRYLFLRIYSNGELLEYLTNMLENDWVIDRCIGNLLIFRKRRLNGARLALCSAECSKRKAKDDELVDEVIEIALKKKWQLLCIGDIESLVPVRRRVYFFTKDASALPFEEDAVIDFQYAYRAYHATLRWSILWFLLCAAALITSLPFMLAEGFHFSILLIDAALLLLCGVSPALFLNRRRLYRHVTESANAEPPADGVLRKCEKLMLAGLGALFIGLFLLLLS